MYNSSQHYGSSSLDVTLLLKLYLILMLFAFKSVILLLCFCFCVYFELKKLPNFFVDAIAVDFQN